MVLKEKYIVQCWSGKLYEERTKGLRQAIHIKRKLQKENPGSYCCIIKIPFRKRHPDFPLWFSVTTLLFLGFLPAMEWCIHHILQIMQLWK